MVTGIFIAALWVCGSTLALWGWAGMRACGAGRGKRALDAALCIIGTTVSAAGLFLGFGAARDLIVPSSNAAFNLASRAFAPVEARVGQPMGAPDAGAGDRDHDAADAPAPSLPCPLNTACRAFEADGWSFRSDTSDGNARSIEYRVAFEACRLDGTILASVPGNRVFCVSLFLHAPSSDPSAIPIGVAACERLLASLDPLVGQSVPAAWSLAQSAPVSLDAETPHRVGAATTSHGWRVEVVLYVPREGEGQDLGVATVTARPADLSR